MCGICGFNWKNKQLIEQMKRRIAHRGPDGEGTFLDKSVSLGHRRLAIIGLTEKGLQPMEKWGLVITYNGEIYNYRAVRDELQAKYRFTTGTDTEVLLAAYKEWGAKMLSKLNGMFAFCIYEKRKQQLFLVRDRFGIKPLYYIETGRNFAFSSEINGLRNLVIQPKIDKVALQQFFTFRFTLGERTMLAGVKKLLPAHYLIYDLKKRRVKAYKQYYKLRATVSRRRSFTWYKEELRRKFEQAVARRMVADVPVSTFLSGGIDSSVISLLAQQHNPKLNTFSMGFETTNELPYARLAADHIGSKHHELLLNKENILQHLDRMVEHMDEPIGDPGFLPILLLSKAVKRHNKVVLSGDGGDEVLTGYDRYKLFHYGWQLRKLPIPTFGMDIIKRLRAMRGKSAYTAFLEIIRLFEQEELTKLKVEEYDAEEYWKRSIGRSRVEHAQAFDIATLLPGDFFMKADKMSCAYGLEQRVPFLDHEFVEFCFSIPRKYKLRLWKEKYILKKAFKDALPRAIIQRPKHGFNVPIDYWFRNVLRKKLLALLRTNRHALYDKSYVYELLEEARRKGNDYKENFILAQKLWSILIFEMWYAHCFTQR